MNESPQRIAFHQTRFFIPLAVVAVLGTAVAGFFFFDTSEGSYPEVADASALPSDYKEVSDFFEELAQQKGGEYAFEVLRRAKLPPNTDLHLLGHVVGDELYTQKGIAGIAVCTDDFRNACSHTIVIGALLEHGDGALPDIRDACYRAPGGKGAYTMCFHGLGHGVLAYLDYELPDAIRFCGRLGTPEYNDREYVECVGGAIMELTGGGGHDPDTWAEKTKLYLRDDEPLYPCTASFMPDEVKNICYTYLTPHLITTTGGNVGWPTEKDFVPAFRACDTAPTEDDRRVCWGSFGKEFVVLAQERDIRNIESMTDEQLERVFNWCELAEDPRGVAACVVSATQSLFWGGENDRNVAVRFCSRIPQGPYQHACVDELIGAVGYYIDDASYHRAFCNELPVEFMGACENALNL